MHVAESGAVMTAQTALEAPRPAPSRAPDYSQRIEVSGKFLFEGDQKYWVKGVTYGTFSPNAEGSLFPCRETVRSDFEAMSSTGINTVRTYTPPPPWLLDIAQEKGLRVMVGLAWEQHVTFLDDRKLKKRIENRIRDGVRACRGHAAVMCFAIGNEIPAPIVRWHGRRRIERFIHRLYRLVKQEDPGALVTYVNYPTTEYLQLPFLDFCCFNVYLEQEEVLKEYLARLQNLAGDKPLIVAEIGLDSRSNGEEEQARQLQWQIEAAFSQGCAGAFVFAWTDEWNRGGIDVDDWDFGLCTRDRKPKAALEAVSTAFVNAPFAPGLSWPSVSVVVCTFNGAGTIRDTLDGLLALDYPDFEVIVVNDGSTDETSAIVAEYEVSVITTENRGLSNARNTGWQAASGEIVAYIDDDAYPDPHWLSFLALAFMSSECGAAGGLSPAPPGDGPMADCVANAPGRPVHVLLTDRDAEHIPGCNMAFRRTVLEAIGGFDPRFRVAGDDVDVCWRVRQHGWKIAYQAGALNWHHCRNSLKAYWKQQMGYGKAEALLEEKWPEKYNALGHLSWEGRVYGKGLTESIPSGRWRIYHGQWGSAPFQSIYAPAQGVLSAMPLMPEWFFVVGLLAAFSLLGLAWSPLLWVLPLLVFSIALPLTLAVVSASKAEFPTPWPHRRQRFRLHASLALLHLTQPPVRLLGRLKYGLTPWRKQSGNGTAGKGRPRRSFNLWSQHWRPPGDWILKLEKTLVAAGAAVIPGGDFDSWDLEVRGGLFGRARILMAHEEHGEGKQQLRFIARTPVPAWCLGFGMLFLVPGLLALFDGAYLAGGLLCAMAALVLLRSRREASIALVAFRSAILEIGERIQDGADDESGG